MTSLQRYFCNIVSITITKNRYSLFILHTYLTTTPWSWYIQNVLCEIENLYGDEFLPSVKASCVGVTMTVRVDTKNPFDGIVHAVEHK